MPRHIEHTDAIARNKGRAVQYLELHPQPFKEWQDSRYEDDLTRTRMLAWFDAYDVVWTECGPFVNLNVMGFYLGQVYSDVPFNKALSEYTAVSDYQEFPDGSIRHAGVRFSAISLEHAMDNVEHDAPGFGQRWAEGL